MLHRGLTATEHEQLPSEISGTAAGLLNVQHGIRLDRGERVTVLEHVQLHVDDGENVVEIMRHTTGKLADGFHLLGLAELLLQLARLGDVAGVDDEKPLRRLACDAASDGLQVTPCPVTVVLAVFDRDRQTGIGERAFQSTRHAGQIVRMQKIKRAAIDHFFRLVAEDARHGRALETDDALGVDDGDDV